MTFIPTKGIVFLGRILVRSGACYDQVSSLALKNHPGTISIYKPGLVVGQDDPAYVGLPFWCFNKEHLKSDTVGRFRSQHGTEHETAALGNSRASSLVSGSTGAAIQRNEHTVGFPIPSHVRLQHAHSSCRFHFPRALHLVRYVFH